MVRVSWLSAQRRSRWWRGRRWWFRRASRGGSGRRPGWCSWEALAIRLRRTDRTDELRVRRRRLPAPRWVDAGLWAEMADSTFWVRVDAEEVTGRESLP